MRSAKTHFLLDLVSEWKEDSFDFLEAFLTSGRSTRRFAKTLSHLRYQRFLTRLQATSTYRNHHTQKRNIRVLANKLIRDGLLAQKKKNGRMILSLTDAGQDKLQSLSALKFPPPSAYPQINARKYFIVTFDIPESMRQKREWLRSVLKHLEYGMIQKSVWVGPNAITKELLEDCNRLRILDYIEIFEASRLGTVRT